MDYLLERKLSKRKVTKLAIAVTAQTSPNSADLKGAVATVTRERKRDKSLSWFIHLTLILIKVMGKLEINDRNHIGRLRPY